jgi:DtxR family Mn-dependent transcriptional regulator
MMAKSGFPGRCPGLECSWPFRPNSRKIATSKLALRACEYSSIQLQSTTPIPPIESSRVPSLTVENYVKMIYLLSARKPHGEAVATGELAQALNVSPGTVTGMLKTLSQADLSIYTPYEGARLTPSGERLALNVLRRHRLVELFLAQTLKMPWDEVHEEAEHIEHAVSERLVDRIDIFLGRPAVDPHGDPIPRADGSLVEPEGQPLTTLSRGQAFHLVRVVDQDKGFLRYLAESGLELGAEGILVENRPEAGALAVEIAGRPLVLGIEAAGKLLVSPTAVTVKD